MDNPKAPHEGMVTEPAPPSGSATSWRGRLTGPLALAALGLAVVGQFLLDNRQAAWLAALALIGAAVMMFLAARRVSIERPRQRPELSMRSGAWWLMALAVILGLVSWPLFAGNRFSRWPARCSGSCRWCSCWSRRAGRMSRWLLRLGDGMLRADGLHLSRHHLILLVIMLVGAFFRLHRIAEIPLEMGCDLPHIYSNIGAILKGDFLIFFPSHPGREGLFFYLAAPICGLFGLSHTTIKISAALVGVATLPVIYALGKRLYSREVGLVAAFGLAISHWHIILTRVGFRACTVPLFFALCWYFLVRGMQNGRRWHYALAGLWLGLGLYSYNAFMLAPLVIAAMLLWHLLSQGRDRAGRNIERSLWLVVMALLAFVPLSRYAYDEPERYLYRAATRITGMESALPQDMLRVLVQNVARSFSMFNYQGDAVFIANVPYLRELGFFSAVLFLLGTAVVLGRLRKGYNATTLIALVGMLLPTTLAIAFPHEVPNAIRAIGVLPAAMLLLGLGWTALRQAVAAQWPLVQRKAVSLSVVINQERTWQIRLPGAPQVQHVLGLVLVGAMLWEMAATYPVYFDAYASFLPDSNYSISLEMARAIDEFEGNGPSYTVVWPYWYDGNAVRAQLVEADPNWHNELDRLMPGQPPLAGPPERFLVMLHPQDVASLTMLQQVFPRGVALTRYDNEGDPALITFYGER